MSFLVDTNVLSELRKGPRCHPAVAEWFAQVPEDDIYLSAVTIGEIRQGLERIRRRDQRAARQLEAWLEQVMENHGSRVLPIDLEVADCWGRLGVPDPIPVVDAFIAATALVHGLTVATRNAKDIKRTGAKTINPFEA